MIPNYREKDIRNLFRNIEDTVTINKITSGINNGVETLDVDFMVDVFDTNPELTERELDDFFDSVELMLKGLRDGDCSLEYGYNSGAWRCADGCCTETDYYTIVVKLK